jgi:DNA-binding MarR family transcriptional regulator
MRSHNSCDVVRIFFVKEAEPVEVLDALEIFMGQIHCAGEEAGLETLIETDLSFSQFRSLLILSQESAPAPIHEVAQKLHLSVAATGRNLDRLVREGLVERQEDEFDRRIKRISLSTSGRTLITGFHQQRRSHVLSFLTGLPAADRQRLIDALAPINSRIAGRSVSATIGVRASGKPPDQHEPQQPLGHQPTTPQEQFV